MSNQLIKTTKLGKEKVFPRTRILDLFDDTSGLKLIDILKSFNMMFVPYLGNKPYTRNQISPELRRQGLWLTYVIDNTVYTEWYDEVAIDDTNWGSDSNWRQGSNALVGDLSVSPNGTWVINGEDSGITIKGDKGDSPVIRIYNNKILVSYDKGVTYEDLNNTPVYTKFRYNAETNTHLVSTDLGQNWTDVSNNKVYYQFRTGDNRLLVSTDLGTTWENCSEPIAAWFRWADTSGTGNVGKVLISRDLLNWSDLSPIMINNLYIKGYVSTIGNLPSSAAIGDIYMVGPTYDESDTTHDYPHYRMWVKLSSGWVDNGEYLSNVLISLTTGLETGITMSLKAITNSINAEQERVDKYLAKIIVTKEDNPNFTQGVVHINGSIEDNTSYGYVAPILLKAEETLLLNQGDGIYQGGKIALVYECNSDGTFIGTLLYDKEHEYKVLPRSYTNHNTDKYVGICGYKAQLKYSIQEKTAATPNNIFEERTAILADGVDIVPTKGSNKLVTSGGIHQVLTNKVDYDVQDVTNTENIRNDTWINYDNGMTKNAAPVGQWTARYYYCKGISKLYCKVGSDGTAPVSIAFYSKKPIFSIADTTYYLKEVSIQAQLGIKEYYVDIPQEAVWVVICNRGATFDSPVVKLYSQEAITKAILNYDSVLLYQSANSVSSNNISNLFDISTIEDYTQLELDITEVSGDSALTIELLNTSNVALYKRFDCVVGKYYFEKTPNLSLVYLQKAGVEENLFNWTLRTTKKYPIQNRTFAPFLPAKQVETIDLGMPFSGYYSIVGNEDTENIIVNTSAWVSWAIQKTNGFVIKIEFDATQYVVHFSTFNETYQRRVEKRLLTSPVEIDLSSCRGWNLAIRKSDYAKITPTDVKDAITVTKIKGTIYEKPLLKYEVEKIVDNKIQDIEDNIPAIKSNTNKALTLSEKGYGLNPFVEKPFYYHFRANNFILDADGRKAIASQSLDDVELAARLGFGLIEANIQVTADGHFIVIHGTGGTFGKECKSINPNVISTADLQATAFNSVTLEWIKTNVRYDSYYEKYQTTLPSLEEFCEACKIHNIGIFAGTNNKDAIDICVKYLGQNVVVYNPPTDIRTYFNGWCFIWNNNSATTIEQILVACRQKGAPVMYGLGPNLAAQLYADDNINTLIDSMHKEGFLIGWTANYDSEENGRKYHKLGMDFSSSENDINSFEANYEVFDIDSDNLPTTTGSISKGIISLANSQIITCGNAAKIIGKAWLSVKFNGTLTFNFGSRGSSGRTITSDGSEDIVITDYFFMKSSTLTITAGAETTVNKFLYKTSRC